MQRSSAKSFVHRCTSGALLGAAFLLAPHARAADGVERSIVTGVVKDAHGVAQMGVLVQLLVPGLGAVASGFTDAHGRYTIAHLAAGRYRLRATATLFAPVTQPAIMVGRDAQAVVNITMAALFDTTSWLPAHRRSFDDRPDDWTWTLRSTANRPILRFDDEEDVQTLSPEFSEAPGGSTLHASLTLMGGNDLFGEQGIRQAVVLEQRASDHLTRSASFQVGDLEGSPLQVGCAMDRHTGDQGGTRAMLTYLADPAFAMADGESGLQAVRVSSSQRTTLGDLIALEVGGTSTLVRAGSTHRITAHPFLKLTASPALSWRLQYRLSTERDVSEFADVQLDQDLEESSKRERAALLVPDGEGSPRAEDGRHQELSLSHDMGKGRLEAAYYHDALRSVLLSGVSSAADIQPQAGFVTAAKGRNFATMVNGSSSDGFHVLFTGPVHEGVWVLAEYGVGNAFFFHSGTPEDVETARDQIKHHTSQTALIAVHGRFTRAGSQVYASYRWQPEGDVSSVDPLGSINDQAFLSFVVRQKIHAGSWLPAGLEATLDVSNLLAQGYQPFLSLDGKTLYLAQTPRSVQAGLAFNF